MNRRQSGHVERRYHGGRARWRLALLVALAASVTLAGCGISKQDHPEALDRASLPDGLLGRNVPTTVAPPPSDAVKVTLWLEGRDEQLVPVGAYVPWPETIGGLLNSLSAAPTSPESQRGLVSPVSSVGPFSSRPIRGGVVTVDLPASFENLGGGDQLIAVAQIVYTLTGSPGVRGVVFRVAGRRAQIPAANGRLVTGPLTRKDYASLAR